MSKPITVVVDAFIHVDNVVVVVFIVVVIYVIAVVVMVVVEPRNLSLKSGQIGYVTAEILLLLSLLLSLSRGRLEQFTLNTN